MKARHGRRVAQQVDERPGPQPDQSPAALSKCPTGIDGLDAILDGGLPRGRPTLIAGAAGCGKTILATEFLVRGIQDHGEPGVLVTFEEEARDLATNFASLGRDLPALERAGQLRLLQIRIDNREIAETGDYDLEALFIRLGAAIDAIGARRIVLDTTEALFAGLQNHGIVRAEMRRLFGWLKEREITAIVTGEQGAAGRLTRFGLEEYVADCVIALGNAVEDGNAVRRIRVVKYRGSSHGSNQFPFLIDKEGITVLPITSFALASPVSSERVSTGIGRLDTLMGGGYFRGSSVLVSGTAGCGKSSIAAALADATCRRGERALMFAFEESPDQIVRNMHSIGLDLRQWQDAGSLRIDSVPADRYGLETHLVTMVRAVERFDPSVVTVDPVSSFLNISQPREAAALLSRLSSMLKARNVTSLFTSLTHGGTSSEATAVGISSIMDVWILLRDIESDGERNRAIHILKARGTAHSNQVRELLLTDTGIDLADVFTGHGEVLVGAARAAFEEQARQADAMRARELIRRTRVRQRSAAALEARIAALRAEHAAAEEVEAWEAGEADFQLLDAARERSVMSGLRRADVTERRTTDRDEDVPR